ncbi:hypothetical protein JCM31598_25780 [Desulfonatronum parangueonense]
MAIELKIGDFKPEHKGKMEFYLEALEHNEKLPEENPPIGIIICRVKNKTIVEYALRNAARWVLPPIPSYPRCRNTIKQNSPAPKR